MIIKTEISVSVVTPDTVAKIIRSILKDQQSNDRDKEQFYSIGLDAKNNIAYVDMVHMGTLNICPAHPREVFRLAVQKAIATMIVAHNHPSKGEIIPSKNDNDLTRMLVFAGNIIGIQVLDHVIVSDDSFYSYAEFGIIDSYNSEYKYIFLQGR